MSAPTESASAPPVQAEQIGELAALTMRGGSLSLVVLGGGSRATYLRADGELLWLGLRGTALHRRALIVPSLPRLRPGTVLHADDGILGDASRPLLDARRAVVWQPLPVGEIAPACELRTRLLALARSIRATPSPIARAVAGTLLGETEAVAAPFDPFAARACAILLPLLGQTAPDATRGAADAVLALVGLGPGLTPSGDDMAGGFLFALAHTSRDSSDGARWAAAIDRLSAETHPLSLALLRDFARGHGPAPLHDLARGVLARDNGGPSADAVARLLAIGHSSGGDLLAGFLAGLSVGSKQWLTT